VRVCQPFKFFDEMKTKQKIIKFLKGSYKVIAIFLYCTGVGLTGLTIETAFKRYFNYPSRNVIQETKAPLAFPKVLICTNSMHSRQRIHRFYQNFPTEALKAIYGHNKSALDPQMVSKLNHLDMVKFFATTTSKLAPIRCSYNGLDCVHFTKRSMQFFGSCIEVDMHQELFVHDSDNEIKENHIQILRDPNLSRRLDLVIGYNRSDSTVGWQDTKIPPTIRLYYVHHAESVYEEEHALELSEKLSPVVDFELKKNTYLNEPFTACRSVNEELWLEETRDPRPQGSVEEPNYSRSLCNYDRRLHFFSGKCGCIPKYFTGDHVHHVNGPG